MLRILPFHEDFISQAAELAAANFSTLRAKHPLLPERLSKPSVLQAALQHHWQKTEVNGSVLLRDGRLVGFMFGFYADNMFFGQHAWVPLGALGLAKGLSTREFAALYQAAGARWVEDGVLNHYLVCPDHENWLAAAFALSFGKEQAHALCPLDALPQKVPAPPEVEIRIARDGDQQQLAALSHWITVHLNKAPVWEPVPEQKLEQNRKDYAELATDAEATTWLAFVQNEVVAQTVIYPSEMGPGDLLGSEQTIEFAVGATRPDFRGRGISRALLSQAFANARQQGYSTCLTDWRTTNLEADRHWRGMGFKPLAYRLIRRINPRYQPYQEDAHAL